MLGKGPCGRPGGRLVGLELTVRGRQPGCRSPTMGQRTWGALGVQRRLRWRRQQEPAG